MKCENMALKDDDKASVQLRKMTSELSLLSRPDGSAMLNQGDSSVLVAVYGPAEVKVMKELTDMATVEVVYKPKVGLPGCAEKVQERLVRNSCEAVILSTLHPRTAISIVVQEMQNSGSLLSCCINASCLALVDAGVPMNSTVAAIHSIIDSENNVILDPTLKEEKLAIASLTFAFESQDKNVVLAKGTGGFSNEQYRRCLLASQAAASDVFTMYRNAVKKKLSKA